MALTRAEILRGIDGYGSMQALIGEAIMEAGGALSERQFDERFGFARHQEYVPCKMTGDTYVLSFNGTQQTYLHLTKYMILAGLLDTFTGEDGLVYYTFPC